MQDTGDYHITLFFCENGPKRIWAAPGIVSRGQGVTGEATIINAFVPSKAETFPRRSRILNGLQHAHRPVLFHPGSKSVFAEVSVSRSAKFIVNS